MKERSQRSLLPLGVIIIVRASMVGVQAWTLIILGLAFIGLGVVRLWAYRRSTQNSTMHKGR